MFLLQRVNIVVLSLRENHKKQVFILLKSACCVNCEVLRHHLLATVQVTKRLAFLPGYSCVLKHFPFSSGLSAVEKNDNFVSLAILIGQFSSPAFSHKD